MLKHLIIVIQSQIIRSLLFWLIEARADQFIQIGLISAPKRYLKNKLCLQLGAATAHEDGEEL